MKRVAQVVHFISVACSRFSFFFFFFYFCCRTSRKNADCLLVIALAGVLTVCCLHAKKVLPVLRLSAPHKSLPMVRCFSSSTLLICPQGVNLGSAAYLPNISTAISFHIFGNSFSKMWQMYDKHHPGFFPLCSICGKLLPCVCFALFFFIHGKERKRETEWLQYK